jgi:hypothetical protein
MWISKIVSALRVNPDEAEHVVQKLEEESRRLSGQNNPRNLGTDVLVDSIAKLIRTLDKSNRTNQVLTLIMIVLTFAIVILTVMLII